MNMGCDSVLQYWDSEPLISEFNIQKNGYRTESKIIITLNLYPYVFILKFTKKFSGFKFILFKSNSIMINQYKFMTTFCAT